MAVAVPEVLQVFRRVQVQQVMAIVRRKTNHPVEILRDSGKRSSRRRNVSRGGSRFHDPGIAPGLVVGLGVLRRDDGERLPEATMRYVDTAMKTGRGQALKKHHATH
jgi:hypothetical protein